ncbi:MAG: TonB-dependent siderophore receptor [Pseudoxanthomonas sp.]
MQPGSLSNRVSPLTRGSRRPLSLALDLALALLVVSGGAMAQEAVTEATDLDAVQVTAPIPRNSGTVTRTDTPIIEIPQSISIITSQQMQDRGVHGVEEAVWYTAGAQGGGYGNDSRSDWLLVRGFTPARYLDGLALADGSGTGITRAEPFGMESIEVLKGPSSVSYGAMPPGGLVNYVSKRPGEEALREVSLQLGSFDLKQATFDFGGKLTDDGEWLYRINGLARDSDDPVDYVFDKRYYLAPSLTWKPSEANQLTLLASYQKAETMSGAGFLPAEGTLLPSPNGKIPLNRFTGEPGENDYDKESKSIGWDFRHDFGGGVRFRQNGRYATSEVVTGPTVGAFGYNFGSDRELLRYLFPTGEESRNFGLDNSLEFRFASGRAEHTMLAGLDYRRGENDYASAFTFGVPSLDVFDPVYGATIVRPDYTSHTLQTQRQLGLYLQDQIKLDKWVVTLGGRQDWVGTDTENLLALPGASAEAHQSDDRFSGRVGINYLFDNGFAPYVGFSQSFQPTVGTNFAGAAFVPTTGDQVEAGIKYQPANGRILATLAVYELRQENTLVVDPLHTLFQIQQGEVTVRGVELEGRWNIGDGFSVNGAYAYTDSEVTETTDPLTLGKEIPLQPEDVASLGADYTITQGLLSGLGFGGGVRYTGEHFGDAFNQWETPAYTLFDATVHYDFGNWRLQLNASNVTDKEYIATCNASYWCYYGYPRAVSATVRYQW